MKRVITSATADTVFYWGNSSDRIPKRATKVIIKDGVKKIKAEAFRGNRYIESISIPSSVTYIGEYAFFACSNLREVYIPDPVTTIDEGAFASCTNLSQVSLPDSITRIAPYTFSRCANLTTIELPEFITEIGFSAFNGCKSLADITIPDSVTTIENNAFEYCTNLSYVVIPDSVKNIGHWAFYGCDNLSRVVISPDVEYIGRGAFPEQLGISTTLEPIAPATYTSDDEEESDITEANLQALLQSNGIDTTSHRYDLYIHRYERYNSGDYYHRKFRCKGDYLAYFSLIFLTKPDATAFQEHFYDLEEIEEFINSNPTEHDAEVKLTSWLGDGGNMPVYLRNLDTGKYLYDDRD